MYLDFEDALFVSCVFVPLFFFFFFFFFQNPPVFAPQSTHCTDTVQHFQATSLPYQASNQHQAANQPSLSLARSVAQDNVRMSSSAPMRPNMPGSSPSPAAFNSYSNGRSNSQQPQMAFRFRVSKPEQQSNSVPSAGKRRHNGTDGGTDSRRRRSGSVEERYIYKSRICVCWFASF